MTSMLLITFTVVCLRTISPSTYLRAVPERGKQKTQCFRTNRGTLPQGGMHCPLIDDVLFGLLGNFLYWWNWHRLPHNIYVLLAASALSMF